MLPKGVCGWGMAFCVVLLFSRSLDAAPGDLQLQVVTQTGDLGSGPGGVAFEEILTIGSGFEFPVSLDEAGSVTFAATTLVDGVERRGVFRGGIGGAPELLYQVHQDIPGLLQNGEPVASTDLRAFSSSPDGNFQALNIWGGEKYLYRVNTGVVEPAPITWGENISKTRNFKGEVAVSDGRGDTRTFGINGAVGTMAVSNAGVVIWETGFGGTSTFFRATSKDDIVAIAFEGTDAPGFDPAINAKLDAPWGLRGIDQFGDSYFVTRIENTGSIFRAVYRHDSSDNSLNLIYPEPGKILEGLTGFSSINRDEDVVVLNDGTVFIRVSINGSTTGFWKREIGGEFVQLALMNEFTGTVTDEGTVGFRSVAVDFADWAVAEDHTVFFTADVRNGVSGINQEGVWRIDPETKAVTTIARAGLAAPGTEATYGALLDIAAAGDGAVVFSCELSDGNKGLFATDTNGGVVKLVVEGERVAIEDGQFVSKTGEEGNAVTSFFFTPDVAGENLSRSQGNWGMNDFSEAAFHIQLDNGTGLLVRASFEGSQVPRGNFYAWDGGAGDTNWHTVVDGRSNWVDASGVPWDKAPDAPTARVEIGPDFLVELKDKATRVDRVTLEGGSLELNTVLECENYVSGDELSSLILKQGNLSGTHLTTSGVVLKEGSEPFWLYMGNVVLEDTELAIEEGTLTSFSEIQLIDSPLKVLDAAFNFSGHLKFQGESGSFAAQSGAQVSFNQSFGLTFDTDTTFEVAEGVTIWVGDETTPDMVPFNFTGTSGEEKRVLQLKGKGVYSLQTPLVIPENGVVINDTIPVSDTYLGFFINIGEGKQVVANGQFENTGVMTLGTGGVSGNLTNKGIIHAGAGAGQGLILDCENEGLIRVQEDLQYNQFVSKTNSRLEIGTSNFTPRDGSNSNLQFDKGSRVTADFGESKMVFPSRENTNMEGLLLVKEAAHLELEKAHVGDSGFDHEVEMGGVLKLKDLIFDNLTIFGKGTVALEGDITSESLAKGMTIQTDFFEVVNATLSERSGVSSTDYIFETDDLLLNQQTAQRGVFENVIIEGTASVTFEEGTEVTIRSSLSVDSKLYLFGIMKLSGDIGFSEYGGDIDNVIQIGKNDSVPGELIVTKREPAGSSTKLEVPFTFQSPTKSKVTFEEGARLELVSETSMLILEGVLRSGNWEFKKGATFDIRLEEGLGSEEMTHIGPLATLTLETESAFGGLPNPNWDLVNEGTFILKDTVLNMTGKTFSNKGDFKMLGSSKIVGNVQSVRNDVQGVIQLAGNLNVEGNLTSDGVLALGASPGSGIITGDLTLLPGSDMRVEFAGAEPGTEFDFLEVGGTVNLDGHLTLSLIDGYMPNINDAFLFLQAGTIAGAFEEIEQDTLGRERRFAVSAGEDGLTATMEALSIASYSDWRAAFFSASEAADDFISGINADPDEDGVVNLAEYMSGGLPESPSLAPLFQVSTEPDQFGLQLANGVDDYTWQLEYSPNLMDWELVATNVLEEDIGDVITLLGIELQEGTPAGDRFYRLGIEATMP